MIIILTQDQDVIRWAHGTGSNTGAWGQLVVISARDQHTATAQLRRALAGVGPDEPLCLVGHGNDTEIGDAGNHRSDWTWTDQDVAGLLADTLGRLSRPYRGAILVQACANTVANFAAHTAVRLERLSQLRGVWLYGYNRPVDVYRTLPDPHRVSSNMELQGTRVG